MTIVDQRKLPGWVNFGLLPGLNVALAFLASSLLLLVIGVEPVSAGKLLLQGAFGSQEGLGFTLYYATNFIFTGLAVAMAFHVGLFNIGGEGQAYIGGLGVGLACLALEDSLPLWALLPITITVSAVFGAAWAFIPAYLQAKRGSHIVITTIMFNFIAASLMVYLMVNVLKVDGQMSPVSRVFDEVTWLPYLHTLLAAVGISVEASPLNLSLFWALLCALLMYIYIWHTRWGYEIRVIGFSRQAAEYGGIKIDRVVIICMLISGALASFVGLNEIQGVSHQLKLDFVAGYGFAGIAVALMGRNHPAGIIIASVLFGALYQGGAELAFEIEQVSQEIIIVIQGFVILFCGALEFMLKPSLENIFIGGKREH